MPVGIIQNPAILSPGHRWTSSALLVDLQDVWPGLAGRCQHVWRARAFLGCLKDTALRVMTKDGKLERHAESETETMAHPCHFFLRDARGTMMTMMKQVVSDAHAMTAAAARPRPRPAAADWRVMSKLRRTT